MVRFTGGVLGCYVVCFLHETIHENAWRKWHSKETKNKRIGEKGYDGKREIKAGRES